MSRCFPFPPPGYEKSDRSDNNEELLKKEKHKEKKHKKDKEKGEKKERKDKDNSKDKHKEKKDRKEKHKARRKDEDNNRTPEDTRTETQAERLPRLEDQFGYSNHKTEQVEDVKHREELVRRIRDEERRGAANQMVGNLASTTKRRLESIDTSTAVEKESGKGNKMVRDIGTARRRNENLTPSIQTKNNGMVTANASTKQKAAGGEKFSSVTPTGAGKNHVKVRAIDEFTGPFQSTAATSEKSAHVTPTEPGRNADTRQPIDKFTGLFQSRAEGMYTPYPLQKERAPCDNIARQQIDNFLGSGQKTEGTFTAISIQKERPGSNNVKSRQVGNAVGSIERSSFIAIAMHKERSPSNKLVPDFVRAAQRSAEGVDAETVEKRTDDVLPSANKKKERKEKKTKDGKREEHKDRGGHEKKSKRKDKYRHKEKEKEEEMSKPLVPCTENASTGAPAPDVNNKKRKENEINGFLHEADGRPNKLPRTSASFPHPPVENGKALELSHIPSACSPIKLDAIIKTKKVTPTSVVSRPPVVIGTGKISSRSSHPDEKYLGKVYCVPKMDEWPESDDQEWVFSSKKLRPLAKLEADKLPVVWAQGLQIESLDVFALPYVIPF